MKIGIAVDNTIPLHIPSFCEFIRYHSKKIRCHPINVSLRFSETTIDYEAEIAKLTPTIRREIAKNDLSILVTTIPYADNFFYVGLAGTYLISLSDWHLLTTLPMSNGLAYILCQIIVKYKMKIGKNHDQNTGCINDFWWDKSGIDVGMRAAFVCDRCKAHSADNRHLVSQEFSDITSMLNSISFASRRGADILFEMPASDSAALKPVSRENFDVFLCHNSQDKPAVRRLNKTLRRAGIKTWLDEEQIKPGELWQDKLEAQISSIAACLIIVGDSGLGPWQDMEQRAFINEFAKRGCKVIPVLIGKSTVPPPLPLFLRQFMWSNLKNGARRQVARVISALRS